MGLIGAEETKRYTVPTPITADHELDRFDCGKPPLDAWLRQHALENEGRASRTYVVTALSGPDTGYVIAFYTLATGGVALKQVPRRYRHGLPNPVPVIILGRLAVDRRYAGLKIGPALLGQAFSRTLEVSTTAGVRALIVHAIDDDAVDFYEKYGFRMFPAGTRTLFLPIETIAASIA